MIRPYMPADATSVYALQVAYTQAHPGAQAMPPEVYAHPAFEDGANILCAWDEAGALLAYAPLFPPPAGAQAPTLWGALRYDPRHPAAQRALPELCRALLERARALAPRWPGQPPSVNVEMAASEENVIACLQAQGWQAAFRVYGMMRDLATALPEAPLPPEVEITPTSLRTEAEQAAWLEAHNVCFPAAHWDAGGLRHLLEHVIWPGGTLIVAQMQEALVGALQVYADPETLAGDGPERVFTEEIFVLPDWRGRGIATAMIAHALAYAREHGYAQAALEVSAQNATALGLYQRLGYAVQQEQVVLTRVLA